MAEEASAASPTGAGEEEPPPRLFTFPSHQSHMLNLAKMCKQNKEFTDCVIQCVDGGSKCSSSSPAQLRAHRLVLGAASKFLRRVFDETPPALSESTLVVPGVRPSVVEALLDFLYSGEMRVRRSDTADLQLLIETLQIDPELISVEEEAEEEEEDNKQKVIEEGEADKTDEKEEAKRDAENSSASRKRKAAAVGGERDNSEDKDKEGASQVKRPK